jgi:MFS family permease
VTARTDRLLLANAIMGQFLTGVTSRIFIISLPTIASALDADILTISWALIAYQLAGISLAVVFGRLGDIYGRYAIYGLGFAIMAVSSLLCGFAPNALWLVLFRFIQGLGAAMLASATRVLAMEAMPEAAAGRANGYMTMAFHGGLLIGPPLGGLVIDLASWRWIFFSLSDGRDGVILTVLRAQGAGHLGRARPRSLRRRRLCRATVILTPPRSPEQPRRSGPGGEVSWRSSSLPPSWGSSRTSAGRSIRWSTSCSSRYGCSPGAC